MTAILIAIACALMLGLWWRSSFLRERPLVLWDRQWSGPTACVAALAETSGFVVEPLAPGWEWLVDLSLSPVWFFWGDLRTRRPARQLRRFRLVGGRHGREARVSFGDDEMTFSLSAPQVPALWADASRPLLHQDGLRALHPVDGPRWTAGVSALERLFALGVVRVSLDHDALSAIVRPATLRVERWDALFDALAALV